MTQFSQWDAEQRSLQKGPAREAIKCKSCECEWFEQITIAKFDMNTICTLGQKAPDDGVTYPQILLRCVRCNDLQELPVNMSGAHRAIQSSYSDLTSELEKPVVKKEKK